VTARSIEYITIIVQWYQLSYFDVGNSNSREIPKRLDSNDEGYVKVKCVEIGNMWK